MDQVAWGGRAALGVLGLEVPTSRRCPVERCPPPPTFPQLHPGAAAAQFPAVRNRPGVCLGALESWSNRRICLTTPRQITL